MKNSGVAWVGAIPVAWKIKRLKDCAQVDLGKMLTPEPKSLTDELLPYMRATNISEGKILRSSLKEMWFSKAEARKLQLRNGDVLVTEGGDIGLPLFVSGLKDGERIGFQNAANRIRWRSNAKFLYFWMSWMYDTGFHINNVNVVSISHLTKEKLEIVPIVIPPLPEQRAIAEYLDQQTVLIDQRLGTLEEKMAVLAELRKATIHEAVTKGLNKNTPMKDSGVAWGGLVPSHWATVRFKDVANLNPSTSLPKLDEIDFFPMEAIGVDGGLTFGQRKPVSQSSGYSQMKNGDVCFAKVTPCFENGKSAIVEGLEFGVALATTEITILRPNKKINRHFLHYRIKGLDFAAGGANEMKGAGGLKRVPERFAADFVFQLPPLTEQLAIANHLDQQTQQIDAQLATLDEQARVLKELRKAIIHEAVTGKIDLSGAVTGKEDR